MVLEFPLASMKHCRCQTRVVLQERGSQVDTWNVGSEDGSGNRKLVDVSASYCIGICNIVEPISM